MWPNINILHQTVSIDYIDRETITNEDKKKEIVCEKQFCLVARALLILHNLKVV